MKFEKNDERHGMGESARKALNRIEISQRKMFPDWLTVGEFLVVAQAEAARRTGGKHGNYSSIMSGILAAYGLDGDRWKNERSALAKIMGQREEIEEFRDAQQYPDDLNNPVTVLRKFEQSKNPNPKKDPPKKDDIIDAQAQTIERLEREKKDLEVRTANLEFHLAAPDIQLVPERAPLQLIPDYREYRFKSEDRQRRYYTLKTRLTKVEELEKAIKDKMDKLVEEENEEETANVD